jgi:hypothetical protein
MGERIPPIVWGLLAGFVIAAATAVRRSSHPRDFLPAFFTVIGATGLKRRSPLLYWAGLGVVALISASLIFGLYQSLANH